MKRNTNWRQRGASDDRWNKPDSEYFKGKKKPDKNHLDPLPKLKQLNKRLNLEELLGILSEKMSHNCLILTIEIISKICESEMHANILRILAATCRGTFIEDLKTFILELPLSEPTDPNVSYYWKDVDAFWNNLHTFLDKIIQTMPTMAQYSLTTVLGVVNHTVKNLKLSDDIKSNFEKLKDCLKCEQLKKKEYKLGPPDNFRAMSLYPTCDDITSTERPFIRKNKTTGSYKNVDEYLDVQFRLLREDFIAPLREGVREYLEYNKCIKNQNVKIHKHVKILGPNCIDNTCGILVQFRVNKKTIFDNSKRFIYGSLLCFTTNNFHTVLFGRIVACSLKQLEKGLILIELVEEMSGFEYDIEYMMVEYNVYFEPYYHVLKSLQRLNTLIFPMKQHIIHVDPYVSLPEYYTDNFLELGLYRFDLRNLDTWPSCKKLSLNDAQYDAYKTALTQEFVVIQGPPGTGKTFLGLFIAKTLIRNIPYDCQLLLISYTNHALDQFLEGVLKFTSNIVRIGGQSKNKSLDDYNIRNKNYYKSRREKEILHESYEQLAYAQKNLLDNENLLKNLNKYHGIISFSYFIDVIPELENSWFAHSKSKNIIKWLLDDFVEDVYVTNESPNTISEKSEEETFLEVFGFDDVNDPDFLTRIKSFYISSNYIKYYLKCSDIRLSIVEIEEEIHKYDDIESYLYQFYLRVKVKMLEDKLLYLQMRLNEGKLMPITKLELIDLTEPYHIPIATRWKLYFYWLDLLKTNLIAKRKDLQRTYNMAKIRQEHIRRKIDVNIMAQSRVIGMTTTSAARLQTSLNYLKCPVVIVEEAAEILESHIVASLSNNCKHLILIGDHQQLRPSTADYTIEKEYKLGISLFERMVNNKINCNMLEVQHRMRPEIARLITPAIYPNLQNHSSVCDFPSVKGVTTSLYFITHEYPEEELGLTKSNPYEADYLLQLAKYLINNGYEASDITILSAYSGQLFTLMEKRQTFEMLTHVNIKVLDDYQGEESKIILLSLVRNNQNNKIGFLSIENRVCVALSRAREGLYIMGNIDLLCANSNIWPKIRTALEEQNAVGKSLLLQCQNHKSTLTVIKQVVDFENVIDGGCNKLCETNLECGHACRLFCHPFDHSNYICKNLCERSCENNHRWEEMCFESSLCTKMMEKLLPCGHTQNVKCSKAPEDHSCVEFVPVSLRCGHIYQRRCYQKICELKAQPSSLRYLHLGYLSARCLEPCTKIAVNCTNETDKHLCPALCSQPCIPCNSIVEKMRNCQHLHMVPCSRDVNEVTCYEPCTKTLLCGHPCNKRCSQPCGKCSVTVEKVLVCQHIINVECSTDPTRFNCFSKCPLILPCGHQCEKRCNEKCTQFCNVPVEHTLEAKCGHRFKIPCYVSNKDISQEEAQQFCQEPCGKVIACGHICSGTCTDCYQGRIHKTCSKICRRKLICGHKCLKSCSQICEPCENQHINMCEHINKKSTCGKPFPFCKQTCSRNCQHIKCNNKCGNKCSVLPCKEPCSKILQCKHPCMGFCGDPCPQLCAICNDDELFPIGRNKENAQFVLLEECGHVFESENLENLFTTGNKIEIKCCPKCELPLTLTKRYRNYTTETLKDIIMVRKLLYGTHALNENSRSELLEKLNRIYTSTTLKDRSDPCKYLMKTLQQDLVPSKTKLTKMPASLTTLPKLLIFERICFLFNKRIISSTCLDYLNFLLETLQAKAHLTSQEIEDYENEIMRLEKMLILNDIEHHCNVHLNCETATMYNSLIQKVYSVNRYTDEDVIKEDMEKLSNMVSYGDISFENFEEITKPIGFNAGKWFKCKNGHVYSNDDAESTCVRCGHNVNV